MRRSMIGTVSTFGSVLLLAIFYLILETPLHQVASLQSPVSTPIQIQTVLPPAIDTPTTPYPTVVPHPADPLPPYVSIDDLPYCDESYDLVGDEAIPTKVPTIEQSDDPSVCRIRPLENSGEGAPIVNPWLLENQSVRQLPRENTHTP